MAKKYTSPYRLLKNNIVRIPLAILTLSLVVNFVSNIVIGVMSDNVDIGVLIILSPPENTVVTNTAPGEVDIEWDESPASDSGDVDFYEIYVKLKIDVVYPLVPVRTENDMVPNSYTYTISGLSPTSGYDFIVRAVSPNGNISPLDCASCEDTNADCGNNVAEPGESCDGTDLNGLTCIDFGYVSGALSCSVTCTYSYAGCSSGGGGGGGGGDPGDTTDPNPGTAESPEYVNENLATITYSGAYDSDSGLKVVELWLKKGLSGWGNTGLTSGGSNGSFNFSSFTDQTTYYFDLVAEDNDGNRSSNPSGDGDDNTIYDITTPTTGTAEVSATSNSTPITVTYSGAEDIGGSGLKQIELWYKKGSGGTWTNSGLTESGESGSFDFTDVSADDTYYFDLVAEDNADNRSADITGDGDTNTIYSAERPTAVLGNLPNNPTFLTTANITVGGSEVIAYKYKLDDGSYGSETDTGTDIAISGLLENEHTLYVIAKNNFGNWQMEIDATEYTWTVDTSIPSLAISEPSISTSGGEDVSYTLTYYDADSITLAYDDITLNTTGDATGNIASITSSGVDTYLLVISDIDGNGTIGISVAENTASHDNGNTADPVGPSSTFAVEAYVPSCGNGISDPGEECDDGNVINGDGCSDICEIESYCGDNTIDPGEECDDGNVINGDGCSDICEIESYCGDNTIDPGEECDDGNVINGDGCSDICEIESYCGDNTIDPGEECDDGNVINGDGCSDICEIESYCGDNTIDPGEECDDGNVINGDGCSDICEIESYCGDNTIDPGEECDDGNVINGDGCSDECLAEVYHCANGIMDEDEEEIDCGGVDCAACHYAPPPENHCENEIRDADELGIDCGGDDCDMCELIDVILTAYVKPEGRNDIKYDVELLLELNNRNQSTITNTQSAIFNSSGYVSINATSIIPGNYDVGVNGGGYLKSVIYNVPIFEANATIELDFTFNNVYELIGGDVWPDNIINAGDIAKIIQTYGAPDANADLNRDGFVNAADMALVLKNYFKVGDSYF